MKIGISLNSTYNFRDVRTGPSQMIARTKAAASAGLSSLFVGDHHSVPVDYYQNTPMMGRLLADWGNQTAGALFLLPLWHPVLVAEQVATLACIHKGRFVMQCALGGGEAQFEAMGANIHHRPSAFEESIEGIRALWRGETVTQSGRWNFERAKVLPLPPEPIEIWIGASAENAIDRAAKLGDVWLADPGLTTDKAQRKMETYLGALAKHDKKTPKTVAIRRDIFVADSAAEAAKVKDRIESKGYRGFDPAALIIGDVDYVHTQFRKLNNIGFTDIIIRNLHPNSEMALRSIERLGKVIKLEKSLE